MRSTRSVPLSVDTREGATSSAAGRLVFVHGSMDTGRSFNELRQALSDAGAIDWATTSYDRRGYGASTQLTSEPAPAPQLADLLADLERLVADQDCVLFGHSLGGVLALAVAARRPDVVRGVICYEAPMPWLPGWPPAPLPEPDDDGSISVEAAREAGERFLRRVFGDQDWGALGPERRARMLSWSPAWAAELVELSAGGWPFDPDAVSCDVLILNGTDSEERHRSGVDEWLRRLPAARRIAVPGGTHVGHRQRAAAVAAAVLPFLTDHRS